MNKVELTVEFLKNVVSHDYSYGYSDDPRYWNWGTASENRIQKMLKELITSHNVDATALLNECLSKREEQFIDGLTHRVIKGWFEPYINGKYKNI
jgi:hypothetical protein